MKIILLVVSLFVFQSAWGAQVSDFTNQCSGEFEIIHNGISVFHPGLRGPDRISMASQIKITKINKDCGFLNLSKNIPVPEVGQIYHKTYRKTLGFGGFPPQKLKVVQPLEPSRIDPIDLEKALENAPVSIIPNTKPYPVAKPLDFPSVGQKQKFTVKANIGFAVDGKLPLFDYLHGETYFFSFSSPDYKIGGRVNIEEIYGLVPLSELSDHEKLEVAKIAKDYVFDKDNQTFGSRHSNPILNVLLGLEFTEVNFFSNKYFTILINLLELHKKSHITTGDAIVKLGGKINIILNSGTLDSELVTEIAKDHPVLFDEQVITWGGCDFGQCIEGQLNLSQNQLDEIINSYHEELHEIHEIGFFAVKKVQLLEAAQTLLSNKKQVYLYSEDSETLLQEMLNL